MPAVRGFEFTNEPATDTDSEVFEGNVFYLLYGDAANHLVRGAGPANRASVVWNPSGTVDGYETFQMVETTSAGTAAPFVTLTQGPRTMVLGAFPGGTVLVPIP
jgi:hypothetical protein